jgi:hypothetical protein
MDSKKRKPSRMAVKNVGAALHAPSDWPCLHPRAVFSVVQSVVLNKILKRLGVFWARFEKAVS